MINALLYSLALGTQSFLKFQCTLPLLYISYALKLTTARIVCLPRTVPSSEFTFKHTAIWLVSLCCDIHSIILVSLKLPVSYFCFFFSPITLFVFPFSVSSLSSLYSMDYSFKFHWLSGQCPKCYYYTTLIMDQSFCLPSLFLYLSFCITLKTSSQENTSIKINFIPFIWAIGAALKYFMGSSSAVKRQFQNFFFLLQWTGHSGPWISG